MDWQNLGIPGAITLLSGAAFFWYHKITQATIQRLKADTQSFPSTPEDVDLEPESVTSILEFVILS